MGREKEVRKESSGKSEESGLVYRVFPVVTTEIPQNKNQPSYEFQLRQLTAQLMQKSNELERLRDYVTKLEEGENGLIHELTRQLATKDEEISRIAALYAKKEAENKKLSMAFEAHIISEKGNAERIKALLLRKEHDTSSQTERLRQEVERKDAEITSLRNALIQTRVLSRTELPDNSAHLKQIEHLQKKLENKETESNRLQRIFLEEQNLNKSAQSRLKEQIAATTSQLEELKAFLIEKEKLVQNLEAAFEKRIAAKEEEMKHLKAAIEHKPSTGIHREVDRLRSELQIKEEASAMMAEEMAKIKEQSALIRRRLEERQKIFFESERAYEELIGKLREQHDTRFKALVQEASQKEAALSATLEEERAKMRKETALMKEKEKQIAETLQAFTRTSEQLIKLGSPASLEGQDASELAVLQANVEESRKQLEEKGKQLADHERQFEERQHYAAKKEAELKKLLAITESKITELKAKEAAVERKEQLLLQEQEGLNKELDVLANAGIEIGKSRQYLQQKLDQIGSLSQPTQTSSYATQPQPLPPQRPTEQPFKPQTNQPQPLKQQPTAQEMGFGASGVIQEAQEEEQFETPRFSGISSSAATQVQEAPTELSDEEGMVEAPKTATTTRAAEIPKSQPKAGATPKIKPVKLSKLQQKKLAKRLKAEAKAVAKAKLKGIVAKKAAKPLLTPQLKPAGPRKQTAPIAKVPQEETAIGAREADGRADGQELFTEMGGYSEVDEIKSIAEVGLQHGDSIEQIRESLLVSGYSKQNIEKVLSGIKK